MSTAAEPVAGNEKHISNLPSPASLDGDSHDSGYGGPVASPPTLNSHQPQTKPQRPVILEELPRNLPTVSSVPTPSQGPMSSTWTLPPPKKPGRKPKTDDDGSRRRTQNRLAQRKFRDTRQEKLDALTAKLESVTKAARERECELMGIVEGLRGEVEGLRAKLRVYEANSQGTSAPKDVRQSDREVEVGGPRRVEQPIMREESAMETDFTTTAGVSFGLETSHCGFCTDQGNCVCSQEPTTHEPKQSGPGTCATCQNDPVQAARCRDLAAAAQKVQPVASGPGIQCNQFMEQVRQQTGSLEGLGRVIGNPLRSYRRPDGVYEVDEREAAAALRQLANSTRKVSR